MHTQYAIRFPPTGTDELDQDEAYFYLVENGQNRRLRFHDYDRLYERQGLYEQLFYGRLKCQSPQKVSKILKQTVDENQSHFSELRILDLGAGNGMMGEALKQYGTARLIGVDILPQARDAAQRDRPWVYDQYYVMDFSSLTEEKRKEISAWSPDCLVSVAALGYGDIPPLAFFEAINLLQPKGWVAFNIKESFLERSETSGFSRLIRELIFSKYLDLHHLERYRHRFSIEGSPLYYFALVGQKKFDIPQEFYDSLKLE